MMAKNVLTRLTELARAEAANLTATSRFLGVSADLVEDIDSLYVTLPSFAKSRGSQNERLALELVLRELMVCGMLLTKGTLATLRMYQADAFTDLRRAIESCAFAVRMSKHPDLCTVWAEAGSDKEGESAKYKAYREAFRTQDVFPNKTHPDYDPLLSNVKAKFDICSKRIHGSVFGVASHFGIVPKDKAAPGKRQLNFFDMPKDTFVTCFLFMLETHRLILKLFAQTLRPHADDLGKWETEYSYVKGKLERHIQKWNRHIRENSAKRRRKDGRA